MRQFSNPKGVSLIIVIFVMMVLAVLGWSLASLQSTDFEVGLRQLEPSGQVLVPVEPPQAINQPPQQRQGDQRHDERLHREKDEGKITQGCHITCSSVNRQPAIQRSPQGPSPQPEQSLA